HRAVWAWRCTEPLRVSDNSGDPIAHLIGEDAKTVAGCRQTLALFYFPTATPAGIRLAIEALCAKYVQALARSLGSRIARLQTTLSATGSPVLLPVGTLYWTVIACITIFPSVITGLSLASNLVSPFDSSCSIRMSFEPALTSDISGTVTWLFSPAFTATLPIILPGFVPVASALWTTR